MGFLSGEAKGDAPIKEHAIQNTIRLALSREGIVLRLNVGLFYTIDGRPVATGLPKGTSDLMFIGNGFVAFIETKAPKGRATDDQLNFLARMRALGHRAGIARSVQDAFTIIHKEE